MMDNGVHYSDLLRDLQTAQERSLDAIKVRAGQLVANIVLATAQRAVIDDHGIITVIPYTQRQEKTLPDIAIAHNSEPFSYCTSEPFVFLRDHVQKIYWRFEVVVQQYHHDKPVSTVLSPFHGVTTWDEVRGNQDCESAMLSVPVLSLTSGKVKLLRISHSNFVKYVDDSLLDKSCLTVSGRGTHLNFSVPAIEITHKHDLSAIFEQEDVQEGFAWLDQKYSEDSLTFQDAMNLRCILDNRTRTPELAAYGVNYANSRKRSERFEQDQQDYAA